MNSNLVYMIGCYRHNLHKISFVCLFVSFLSLKVSDNLKMFKYNPTIRFSKFRKEKLRYASMFTRHDSRWTDI